MARFALEEYKVEGEQHVQIKEIEKGEDDASLQLKMADFHRKGWKVRLYDHTEKTFLYPEVLLARYEASLKELDAEERTPLDLLMDKREYR